MRNYRSNFQNTYNHPNIVVWLDDGLDTGVDWLLSYFEGEIKKGVVFHAGQTVQIGWALVTLKCDENEGFEIWEPQFDFMPIKWIRGVNNTFRHLTLQREVCAQIGVEPEYPSLRQSGLISTGFVDNSDDFKMTRETPIGTDSGWIFSQLEPKELDARYCSLFEISITHSAIIPLVALPVGASVIRTKSKIEISYESIEISSDSNEFLRKILASPIFP